MKREADPHQHGPGHNQRNAPHLGGPAPLAGPHLPQIPAEHAEAAEQDDKAQKLNDEDQRVEVKPRKGESAGLVKPMASVGVERIAARALAYDMMYLLTRMELGR